MKQAVQFSTGIGSGEVLRRVVAEHGSADVLALTADTLIEDPDNWRYGREVIDWLGCEWAIITDGRTPMEVGRDRRCVPSDRIPVCSIELKIKLLRKWLDEHCDPSETVVHLGFDWTEDTRIARAAPLWTPFEFRCPLAEEPLTEKWVLLRNWPDLYGIDPPSMYAEGYGHANCGGCCVRQGQADWRKTLVLHPDRYARAEADEEATRQLLGKDVAMMRHRSGPFKGKPLTLRDFRLREEQRPWSFDVADVGVCGCMAPPLEEVTAADMPAALPEHPKP